MNLHIDAAARRVEKAAVRQMVQHRGARMDHSGSAGGNAKLRNVGEKTPDATAVPAVVEPSPLTSWRRTRAQQRQQSTVKAMNQDIFKFRN